MGSNYIEVNIMNGIVRRRRRKAGNDKILKTLRSEEETGGVQRETCPLSVSEGERRH